MDVRLELLGYCFNARFGQSVRVRTPCVEGSPVYDIETGLPSKRTNALRITAEVLRRDVHNGIPTGTVKPPHLVEDIPVRSHYEVVAVASGIVSNVPPVLQ